MCICREERLQVSNNYTCSVLHCIKVNCLILPIVLLKNRAEIWINSVSPFLLQHPLFSHSAFQNGLLLLFTKISVMGAEENIPESTAVHWIVFPPTCGMISPGMVYCGCARVMGRGGYGLLTSRYFSWSVGRTVISLQFSSVSFWRVVLQHRGVSVVF